MEYEELDELMPCMDDSDWREEAPEALQPQYEVKTVYASDPDQEPGMRIDENGYKVKLDSTLGAMKLAILKLIKDTYRMSMADAKYIIDNAPQTIDGTLDRRTAENLVQEIIDAGGKASIVGTQVDTKPFDPRASKIMLNSPGPTKLQMCKIIKEGFGIGLAEAKSYVDSTPCLIDYEISRSVADGILAEIIDNGGDAYIV